MMNHKLFVLILVLSTLTLQMCFNMPEEIEHYRFKRGLTFKGHEHGLNLGTPEDTDTLLLDTIVKKGKRLGLVVYDDIAFGPNSYSNKSELVYDCPFVITAVETTHLGPEETGEHPMVLYGGVGLLEILILFISQRDEGINVHVQIWGREFESSNVDYNLLEGLPSKYDNLLLFTNLIQLSEMTGPVTSTVVYEKPEGRNVTITSIQAWDVSSGCKTGGYPIITEGGVGQDNAVIKITSEKFTSFQYHVLVFGKVTKLSKNE